MKASTIAIGSAVVGGVLTAVTLRKPRVSGLFGGVTHRRLADLEFTEMLPGVSKASLVGEGRTGAYAAITHFEPGQVNPRHKHPNDIHMFVITGAYIYRTDTREIRVGPNEYLYIPAGDVHVSAGDPIQGATFLEQSPGAFDLIIVD